MSSLAKKQRRRSSTKTADAPYWGVVEGFYGRPWTAAQRAELCAWMAASGLNSYFYTPKDDQKHRALWQELYSKSERAWLEPLIRDCSRRGLRFIYGIAPGLSRDMRPEQVERLLVRKILSLQSMGCRYFALLFDDIPAQGAEQYLKRYGSWAGAHIAWTHQVRDAVLKKDPGARFLFCPTPYCEAFAGTLEDSAYLRELGQSLSPDIEVLWTGKDIVSRSLDAVEMRRLAQWIGRPPVVWDNLFANDYDMRRLYLGPFDERPQSLKSAVRGIFINPNCEYRANHVPLHSFASYVTGDKRWTVERSYGAALESWRKQFIDLKGALPTLQQMRLLCDSLHLPYNPGRLAARLLSDVRLALQSKGPKVAPARKAVRQWAGEMAEWQTRITELRDRDLCYTLYRHVWELKEEADLLLRYLDWLESDAQPKAPFHSMFHQQGTYRGGMAAALQRCLPMSSSGDFAPESRTESV